MKGYYFITDSGLSRAGNHSDVESAIAAGVKVVQYRQKRADTRDLIDEAKVLKQLCTRALFLVNDRVDVALAVDADGVHLGQEDMPLPVARQLMGSGRIIGITVHDLTEAREAAAAGADYLGVSPIFATQTKDDAGPPAGLALLRQIRAEVTIPLIAIGGITLANAAQVIAAGADGLCAISATVTREDVALAIEKFQQLFQAGES